MLVGLAGARLRAAAGIKDYDVLGEVMCPEHFELMQSLVVNAAEIAKKAGL
jgi:hypothetical protein